MPTIQELTKQIDTSVALLHVAKAAYRAHAENIESKVAWEDLSTGQRLEWMAAMERVTNPEIAALKNVSAIAHATMLGFKAGRSGIIPTGWKLEALPGEHGWLRLTNPHGNAWSFRPEDDGSANTHIHAFLKAIADTWVR